MVILRTLLIATFLPAALAGSSVLLNQSFGGTTAANWTMLGDAQLTAVEGIDPVGSGWLQITNNSVNQTGFAYDNTPVPFGYGLDISFSYETHNTWGQAADGADGFAFVLFDGSVTPTSAGAYGGSLGYAQHGAIAGLAGGILGIGFDEYGNYANPTEGRQGGPGFTPDAVSIRGPGDGTADATAAKGSPNYGFLFTSGSLPQYLASQDSLNGQRPKGQASERNAEIIIDTSQIASGHLPVTVMLSAAGGPKTVVAQYDAYADVLAYYGSPGAIPADIKFGFTGSTGSYTDYHEIQNLQIDSLQSVAGYTAVTATPETSPATSCLIGLGLLVLACRREKGKRS
jgi:hypothetical protein